MDTDLYDAVIQGDTVEALQATCQCLIQERWVVLEETWVRLVALLGERLGPDGTVLFYRLAMELYDLVREEDLVVRQSLLFTAKLLLAFKRPVYRYYNVGARPNLQKLRSKVISYFPSDAHLTRSGKQKFQYLLPTDPEETAFAERIIAGLLQLASSQRDLKDALEYLSRKKLSLETVPLGPEEDFTDYLWTLMALVKPLSYMGSLKHLYRHAYKPSVKMHRMGYFYALAFLTESSATSVEPTWTSVEEGLLEKISENALVLWKEAKAGNRDGRDGGDGGNEGKSVEIPMFIPMRGPVVEAQPIESAEPAEPMGPEGTGKEMKKKIRITKGKGRNKLIQSMSMSKHKKDSQVLVDVDEDEDEDEDEKMRSFEIKDNRRKKKEDEAYHPIAGHRWFHIDKERPRT
jgi:hypothetical protein